jgi:hypothetical protein
MHVSSGRRRGRLRVVGAVTRHLTRTMPWRVLAAGCIAALGISVAARQFALPGQPPSSVVLTVRAAFAPVAITLAFLATDPHRALAATLPTPPWVTMGVRLVIALPALGLTAWIQLGLAGDELAASTRLQGTGGTGPANLPMTAIGAELAAWSAIALAAGVLVARTRWSDLGGAVAAPAAIACIALLALTPLRLFPGDFTGLTPQQQDVWLRAEWSWWAITLSAIGTSCWASRDPWLRLTAAARHGGAPCPGTRADSVLP